MQNDVTRSRLISDMFCYARADGASHAHIESTHAQPGRTLTVLNVMSKYLSYKSHLV